MKYTSVGKPIIKYLCMRPIIKVPLKNVVRKVGVGTWEHKRPVRGCQRAEGAWSQSIGKVIELLKNQRCLETFCSVAPTQRPTGPLQNFTSGGPGIEPSNPKLWRASAAALPLPLALPQPSSHCTTRGRAPLRFRQPSIQLQIHVLTLKPLLACLI